MSISSDYSCPAGRREIEPLLRGKGGAPASRAPLALEPIARALVTTMSRELLNPIPQDLVAVSIQAAAANNLAGDTVQQTIERLERARQQLVSGEHPDQLLALSSYLKTSNAKIATAHKDWSSSVSKFGKSVDKVRLAHPSLATRGAQLMFRSRSSLAEVRNAAGTTLPTDAGRADAPARRQVVQARHHLKRQHATRAGDLELRLRNRSLGPERDDRAPPRSNRRVRVAGRLPRRVGNARPTSADRKSVV